MNVSNLLNPNAATAAESIRQRWNRKPQLGIVLGTGSGQIADSIEIDTVIDYESIPNFPASTALGHSGKMVCGSMGACPVIAMKGRFHPYEGHSFEQITLPIHLFKALGVRALAITNAVGGINPKFRSGELMAIESHIDLMGLTSGSFRAMTTASNGASGQRTVHRIDRAYDQSLIEIALKVGREQNFVIHRGVYGGLLGPNYETRAEYRMLRRIGADVAGMSTIGEVAAAALLKLPVLAVSVVTNVAKPDVLESTSGQEVIDAAQVAEPFLLSIVQAVARSLDEI